MRHVMRPRTGHRTERRAKANQTAEARALDPKEPSRRDHGRPRDRPREKLSPSSDPPLRQDGSATGRAATTTTGPGKCKYTHHASTVAWKCADLVAANRSAQLAVTRPGRPAPTRSYACMHARSCCSTPAHRCFLRVWRACVWHVQ